VFVLFYGRKIKTLSSSQFPKHLMKSADMACGLALLIFWTGSFRLLSVSTDAHWDLGSIRDRKNNYSALETIVNGEISWLKLTQNTVKLKTYLTSKCICFYSRCYVDFMSTEDFFFFQSHHMSLTDFVVSPPDCSWSVTDVWVWDAHEAQLRCPDEVVGDIWIWGTRRGLLVIYRV
jgi:hypothetical protein